MIPHVPQWLSTQGQFYFIYTSTPPPVLMDYFEMSSRCNILFVNVLVSYKEVFKNLFAQKGDTVQIIMYILFF